MLAVALHLRSQELSLRDIAARLVIAGKKNGRHPSPATVIRMLCEHDEETSGVSEPLPQVQQVPSQQLL